MPRKRELLRAWPTSALTGAAWRLGASFGISANPKKTDATPRLVRSSLPGRPLFPPHAGIRAEIDGTPQKLSLSFGANTARAREGRSVSRGEDASSSSTSKTHALSSRPTAQHVQAMRRRQHLRARAAAQPVQGVRRRQHLRARAAAPPLQGVRRQRPLRARAAAQPVQGVRRQP